MHRFQTKQSLYSINIFQYIITKFNRMRVYNETEVCNTFPILQLTLVTRNHPVHPSGTMVIQLEYQLLYFCSSPFRTSLAIPLNYPELVNTLRTHSLWLCYPWIPSSV